MAILIGAGLNAAANTLWPVALHEGADVRLVNWAMEGAGGLLTRAEGDAATSDTDPPATYDGVDGRPTARRDGRGRDQQFESSDRGPITAAIQRGVGRGRQHGAGTARGCAGGVRIGPRRPS